MNELDQIALDHARALLEATPGVNVLSEWRSPQAAVWMAQLRLELFGAEPTLEVARFTEWELVVDFRDDPWGKVQLHPADNEHGLRVTFEHQQFNGTQHPKWPCRNGHLCTQSWSHELSASRHAEPDEPAGTIPRICWHVARGLDWLAAAATSRLAQPGDPFELPDFNVGSAAVSGVLAYCEDAESYVHWQNQPDQAGIAELSCLNQTYVVRRFQDKKGRKTVFGLTWGASISNLPVKAKAIWIRLDALPVVNRWQVPATGQELLRALQSQGIDLIHALQPLLPQFRELSSWLLLVGMPIPTRVGQEPSQYHWQALQLSPPGRAQAFSRGQLALNHLRSTSSLRWMAGAENWHPKELQNRGRLNDSLANANVLLLGAGALGSVLAEQLVRMGVSTITIADGQWFEAGNLVRHTLGLPQVQQTKAQALATRLNELNPFVTATGLAVRVPTNDTKFQQAASQATLVIDATASDLLLREMPFSEIPASVPFISVSLGMNAERLYLYASPAGEFTWEKFNQWFHPYRLEETARSKSIELPRGAGCWHPLTPARLNRVTGLAGVAIELIEQIVVESPTMPVAGCYLWEKPTLASA